MSYGLNGKIKIGITKLNISLPVRLAKRKKIFEKYGLEVEFEEYPNAKKLISALIENEIHAGGYCALPIAFSEMEEKQKLLFIGGVFESEKYPISFMLAKQDRDDIKSVEDLEGKKIGILPTDAYKIWLKSIFYKLKIPLLDKNIIQIETSEQVKKFNKDKIIDVLFTNDPIATTILECHGGKDIHLDAAIVPSFTGISPFYFGSFNVTKKFADENRTIIKKITLALDESIDILGKNLHTVDGILQDNCDYAIKENMRKITFRKSMEVDNNDLGTMQLYYFQQNLLSKKISVSKLQYSYEKWWLPIWLFFTETLPSFVGKYWQLGTIVAVTIGYTYTTLSTFKEQKKQIESRQKSLQIRFQLRFKNINDTNRAMTVELINKSWADFKDVKSELEFYFINEKDEIFPASNMESLLKKNNTKFKKLVDAKFIRCSDSTSTDCLDHFSGYFGFDDDGKVEPFQLLSLKGRTKKKSENIAFGTISISSFENAEKIADILNMKLITRWKIQYTKEMSEKIQISNKYIWHHQIIKNKKPYKKIQDLEDIYGGKRIIKLIEEYERTTKNIIFN